MARGWRQVAGEPKIGLSAGIAPEKLRTAAEGQRLPVDGRRLPGNRNQAGTNGAQAATSGFGTGPPARSNSIRRSNALDRM